MGVGKPCTVQRSFYSVPMPRSCPLFVGAQELVTLAHLWAPLPCPASPSLQLCVPLRTQSSGQHVTLPISPACARPPRSCPGLQHKPQGGWFRSPDLSSCHRPQTSTYHVSTVSSPCRCGFRPPPGSVLELPARQREEGAQAGAPAQGRLPSLMGLHPRTETGE